MYIRYALDNMPEDIRALEAKSAIRESQAFVCARLAERARKSYEYAIR